MTLKSAIIDWSDSETPDCSIWKNPLESDQKNLLICDGAVHFRDKVIANLRGQIAERDEKIKQLQKRIADMGWQLEANRDCQFSDAERWGV